MSETELQDGLPEETPESGQAKQGDEASADWRRPLSQREDRVIELSDGTKQRVNHQGTPLCHARRRDGQLCKSIAVRGMRVCRMHGGSTPNAKRGATLRLAELVMPAIGTLAREMAQADKSVDRQRAANSILDRSGFGRQQKVEAADAKELLYQRLLAMNEEATAQAEPDTFDTPDTPDTPDDEEIR